MTGDHSSASEGTAKVSTSMRPTKPAGFDTTERYAATSTGAPTEVSGTHMWNGTAATLKASPTIVSSAPATATVRSSSAESSPARAALTWSKNTDPVAP